MQRLSALDPEWLEVGGRIVGITFTCPVCSRWGSQPVGAHNVGVLFSNPPDGGPAAPNDENIIANYKGKRWTRTGTTFDDLSIAPSIDCTGSDPMCWHGHVLNGVVT